MIINGYIITIEKETEEKAKFPLKKTKNPDFSSVELFSFPLKL